MLASAYELFAHHGFESITIDKVTKHAGLTRGAFYNHFSSKQDLYQQAMKFSAYNSRIAKQMESSCCDETSLASMIDTYLSHEHLNKSQPCPLAFLVTDVANQEPQVRDTYTKIFATISKNIVPFIETDQSTQDKREKSQALTALLIGGVAVSRALSDDKLTNQLLKACKRVAMDIVKT